MTETHEVWLVRYWGDGQKPQLARPDADSAPHLTPSKESAERLGRHLEAAGFRTEAIKATVTVDIHGEKAT